MLNLEKYKRLYFSPEDCEYNWVKKDYIPVAPNWCSVDLRDGNQALDVPMNLEQKIEFFKMLLDIGLKDIEVGFPAASQTEFDFVRTLINKNLIPKDVRIQVLTQSREHIIKRTFEAIKGAENVIVHLYNSTSVSQREQVFKKSKKEIINLAVSGTKLIKEYKDKSNSNITLEYSPESFTGTEMEFSKNICNAVLETLQPTKTDKAIINLPVTVELSLPHIYANQVEYMKNNLSFKDEIILSLHAHNDRGSAIAATEMGILAGGDRVEGTLFGNGERTGNADLITLALNLYSHGIDPKLNLNDIPKIIKTYEKTTGKNVYERQPYSGKLVFTAFSGSHQDAIAKSIEYRKKHNIMTWNTPYIPIDPRDIGIETDDIFIRINSQSGKGGIGYILKNNYSLDVPKGMLQDFGRIVKNISDTQESEIDSKKIKDIFFDEYVNYENKLKLIDYHFFRDDKFNVILTISYNGKQVEIKSKGNGRLNAVNNALKDYLNLDYTLFEYKEHSLEQGSTSKAISYVGINNNLKGEFWGAGTDEDIITSSIKALFSTINKLLTKSAHNG